MEETTFVAIAPFAWGKGDTVSTAVKNCKKEVPRVCVTGEYKVVVFRVTGFQYVSDMGSIVYQQDGSVEKVDERTFTMRTAR